MESVIQLLALSAACFGIAFIMGYALVKFAEGRRCKQTVLPPGTPVRIRAVHGVYRGRVVCDFGGVLHFQPILGRGNPNQLVLGEAVTIEAPTPYGAFVFRSPLDSYDPDATSFSVAKPATATIVERRDGKRRTFVPSQPIHVDGRPANLVDLSEKGARFASEHAFDRGERVHLAGTGTSGDLPAWILDRVPPANESEPTVYRVVFEKLAFL